MVRRIVSAVLLTTFAVAQTTPERTVEGTTIISPHDPSVRIEVPKSAHYAGADRWILYGVADCELHAFVETDPQGTVQRLYWVQFEGYIPSKPDLHHEYKSTRHAQIGGLDFLVDTWVRARSTPIDAGSDREHIEALIRAKRYKMPAGMMYVRLVHLLDAQNRRELMIIYGEDLALKGFTAEELGDGGSAHDVWPTVDADLLERAKKKIAIQTAK